MPSVEEALTGNGPLAAALAAGVDALAGANPVTFTKYVRVVLPLDGFVFWVRSDLLSADALLNATQIGPVPLPNEATFDATGSLHYATDRRQLEDETIAVNRVVFTSKTEIAPFNEISPVVMFVGLWEGIRFAFSARRGYYKQAGLHHYVGDAVYPALQTQIIDDIAVLDTSHRIVSNSLPIWLKLNRLFPVYPSFQVPENVQPPYAAVHVVPGSQRAIQMAPVLDARTSTHWRLVFEQVRITLYGVRNDQALDYLDQVFEFTLIDAAMGISNMPVVVDEKRAQSELSTLAQKKSITFEVNYQQTRVNDLARQLIKAAVPTFTFA